MAILLGGVLLIINFGISWWNANSVGRIWSESKQIRGGLRVLAVSGYIMSIAGFTTVYSSIIMIVFSFLGPSAGWISPDQGQFLLQLVSDLSYVLIVMAIIPTGIIIWINSLIVFWKRKSLASGGLAAWNTYATARNVINAARNVPSAFGRIIASVKNSKAKGNGAIVLFAIVIVMLAVLGGYFTASAIMKRADKKYDLFQKVAAEAKLAY